MDVFLAFEKAEALRNLNQLRMGALALVNLAAIEPVTVTSGGQPYPDDATLHQKISEVTREVHLRGRRSHGTCAWETSGLPTWSCWERSQH